MKGLLGTCTMANRRGLSYASVLLLHLGTMTILTNLVESQDMDNRTIIVTSVLGKPYLFLKNTTDPATGNDRYEGFIKDLLDQLSHTTGYQYQLSLQTSFGIFDPENSTWSGMIGELIKRNVDMSLAPLTETYMRARVVDFGTHFQTFGRVAIVKQWPRDQITVEGVSLDVRLGHLFAPLDDSVWLLSGIAWFVASLVLYIICRINPYEWRRMVKDHEATLREGESFSCVNSYWFMLSAIFWQGFMRSPRSMGARVVVTFWWLYALIFVSMYIASLTNYLQSVPQLKRVVHHTYTGIRNMNDIVENENVKVGAIKDSATEAFFRYSNITAHIRIWRRLTTDKAYEKTLADGIKRVRESTREEPYVFFAESTMAESYVRQPPCDLYMFRDFPFLGSYAAAFYKGSKLKSVMNFAFYALKDNGVLSRLQRKWFNGQCKGNYMETAGEQPKVFEYPPFQKVDLASFSGALILLIIGLAAGSLVTLIEILIFKYVGAENQGAPQDKSLVTIKHKQEPAPNTGHTTTNM